MATNYVIVISVLEGKNFPVRHDKYLVVEAKFDGEVMSTDPVSHIIRPHFNTELAWEVDKKGLQMHRLQRSPIKLQWYAVDLELTKKETIGYMILDIRLAQEKLQSPKWFPLLNSKYQKEKPEVLLSLYLERVTEEIAPPLSDGNIAYNYKRNSISDERNGRKKPGLNAGTQKSIKPANGPLHSNSVLKPVLLSQAGCYQIGPPELCSEKFIFSVTLSFAANLNKLTPPAMLKSSKGFYFYYSLFDNDVMTEKFSSLSNPDFLAERASVRISSSSKLLSEYFEQHPYLEIILCSGEISLGSGQIPLGPFSCVNSHDINKDPLCIEGSVQINPTERTSRTGGDDLSPFVGVTVVLQADKPEEQLAGQKGEATPLREESIPEEKNQTVTQSEKRQTGSQNFIQKIFCLNNEEQLGPNNHIDKRDSPRDEHSTHIKEPNAPDVVPCNHSSDSSPPESGDTRNLNRRPISVPMKTDGSARHFSFSLDLCNFQATRLAHPINLFIRYSYPFFGTTSSMITHPEVEINPKCEVSIPHGYCAFKFATPFNLLKSTFWETPLILEVLHRKKNGQEQLVGTARINLFQVLDAPSISHTVDKKQGMRQMSTCKVVVTSPEGYEIGEIYAVLTLIDFGRTTALCDHHSNQSSVSYYPQVHNFIPNFDLPLLRQNGLTQDELLQAALELELWQERQREIFRAQLKDKEMQHLSVLTSEWKQRDMERELLLQRQLQECQKLEDKLKATLKDAELKEKQLSSQEAELSQKMRNIDKQKEQQQKETKNHIESIKMEYNELLAMERLNVRDLEQKNNSLLRQIKELERDLQDHRSIIETLKSQVNKDPDIHLRTEVNILNMEKAELQQKLEATLSSKQKYKIQWSQAVRQISLLQQKLHLMERLELAKKDEELTSLQQRILATEDKNAVRTNEEILEMVKDKVESLKSVVSPENVKLLERQISLGVDNAQAVPTNSRTNSNSLINKSTVSNSVHLNGTKQLTNMSSESTSVKSNVNVSNNVQPIISSSNSMKTTSKSSNLTKATKDTPDMNGNTTPKECNIHLQNLLAKKENLLTAGMYTEQDQLIKDLNAHIDKAKLASK